MPPVRLATRWRLRAVAVRRCVYASAPTRQLALRRAGGPAARPDLSVVPSPAHHSEARALRERALGDDLAYELTRSLTTEVARGSPARRATRPPSPGP